MLARMHVGVEEIVAEHLREENFHAVLREPREIGAARPELLELADDDAVDPLHHHDVRPAEIPIHGGT